MTSNNYRIHLYSYKNILRPRGHMKKESVAEYILERLEGAFESWTDDDFADNPEVDDLIIKLKKNLSEEVDGAWDEFIKQMK